MQAVERRDTLLVVDDDDRIRDLLCRYLNQEGFKVLSAANSLELNRLLKMETPDLMVLDLMLPGESGMEICQRLRTSGSLLPILMLTAKHEDTDRIMGLEIGADDYLVKPFNPRELLARINAVLRRHLRQAPYHAPGNDNKVLHFGPFTLDLGTRTLRRENQELPLTSGEFAMLKALVCHPNTPLSREKLARLTRGREFEPYNRSMDVQISRLRKLIEPDLATPRYIQTVWGKGYVFVPVPIPKGEA